MVHRHVVVTWFAYVLFSCWCLRALLVDEHDRDDRHTWIAALYFCAVTILTVGYGDVRPTTTAGKLYVIFFILVAACLASVLLSRVAERIPEFQDRASRIISRKKERVMRVDVAKLRERIRSNRAGRSPSASEAGRSDHDTTTSEEEQHRAADDAAEAEEENTEWEDRPKHVVAKALTVVATFVVVGATCMMLVERRSAVDAFYWAVTTVTTVGYGDITPETDGGRLFVLLFVTCAVATLAWAGTTLVEVAVVATSEATAASVFRRENNARSPRQSRGRQGIRHGDGFHEGGVGAAGKMRRAGFPNHRGKFRRVGRQRGQDDRRRGSRRRRQSARRRPRARAQGGEREREKGGRRGRGLKTTDPHA